jgi:hypothetical protein
MYFPQTTETELSSVNSILAAIGQAPISRLYETEPTEFTVDYTHEEVFGNRTLKFSGEETAIRNELKFINPEIALIHSILMEVNADVQNEGWTFNTEFRFPLTPDAKGFVKIPVNVLRMDISDGQIWRDTDVVRRGNKLYDRLHHTDKFTPDQSINFDITWKWDFEELPSVFKRYITLRASGRAATQMVTNPQLVQLLQTQEAQARASCLEYECNQGDHTFFGTPSNTGYRSYQPYITLAR